MTSAIPLVTTSLYNEPANNSQTRFAFMEGCEDAPTKLTTDAQILRDSANGGGNAKRFRAPPNPPRPPAPLPMVSAVWRPSEVYTIHGPPDLPEVSRTYENLPYRK
jgi:hypothetical protein